MKIAPIDIAHKTFQRKVMGLDPDEVADFLRDVADQMEEMARERNALKEALRQKDLQVMEYKERDEMLKATLQTATKMSEQIRLDAEREAKLITGDAQQKAEMILKDSRDSLRKVYQDIADIKRLRMQFEVNLRALCQAHVSMLDQSHFAMPDPQVNLQQAAVSTGAVGTSPAPAPTKQAHAAAQPAPIGGHGATAPIGGHGATAPIGGHGATAPMNTSGFQVPPTQVRSAPAATRS